MSQELKVLNGDFRQRLTIDTQALPWTASPGGHVQRKRLHLVGRAEAGQVTSLVRYEPGARFPRHDHPEGEEILVLEGVFSDDRGHWHAGTYLLNPEGYSHAPYSEEGCTLFVKLRQYPGNDREKVALQTADQAWRGSVRKGVAWKKLYAQEPYADSARLERWEDPASLGTLTFPAGAELLVLAGAFTDEHGTYPRWSWLRIPPGGVLMPTGGEYCELYIKEGGFAYLREAA
ncbi:cupin domain-containing protein [Pseudohaliea sp.]|uniref:cupin domain-containing protein n=1 Tax=Pseudohaliea sp. TaxID=2740289 RepID=UPI0032EFA076